MENKRLAKFYNPERPPRKRLRTLLEYLKNPNSAPLSAASLIENLGAVTSDGMGLNTANGMDRGAAGGAGPGGGGGGNASVATLNDFWADTTNSSMLFQVLNDCIAELETMYSPHQNAFGKMKKKNLEADDWTEIFDGLDVLIRNNIPSIHEGWLSNGFSLLFAKLLRRENHAFIKKYAFRCLALYTDAMRSMDQLAWITPFVFTNEASPGNAAPGSNAGPGSTAGGSPSAAGAGAGGDIKQDEDYSGAAAFRSASMKKKTFLFDLLRESIDFTPYGGGSIQLPDKFVNDGVHVDGWMRPVPTQAEEPVDMLKFLMDLSLEKEEPKVLNNPRINAKARGERFAFWCEVIMKCYMPLLFPKVCIKAKLKEENDPTGFFHHCPGSFQRVAARWVYKLRNREDCMEMLWSRKEFSDVFMETIRQRFAYRDSELVLDALKFYSGICLGTQLVPEGMQQQMHEVLRSMISHVSQLFHPSVQLEDPKLLLNCVDLLELVSQRKLDDYTSTYLRKFVISSVDNCTIMRERGNLSILSAMISLVLHVWIHASVTNHANSTQVWIELTVAIRRWLLNLNDPSCQLVAMETIQCWRRELRFASCLVLYLLDQGQSKIKYNASGAVLIPIELDVAERKDLADGEKIGYLAASANFLTQNVTEVSDALVLVDRILHLIPPGTVQSLSPTVHVALLESMLKMIEFWTESTIQTKRRMPSLLHQISPSTILALFGKWFLPACELDQLEFQNSRCLGIIMLCKLCLCDNISNPLTSSHLSLIAKILVKGITSQSSVVVSTVLQKASCLFARSLPGMNILVPAFLFAMDQIVVQSIWKTAQQLASKLQAVVSEWNGQLNAVLDVVFTILALPQQFPKQNFASWRQKIVVREMDELFAAHGVELQQMESQMSDAQEHFYGVLGRILVRIVDLPLLENDLIKRRALWGLNILVTINLQQNYIDSPLYQESALPPLEGAEQTDKTTRSELVAEWILKILESCHVAEFSISMASLSIIQDLSCLHQQIQEVDPQIVPRIVMTLAVFAQQQVEEASIEVQNVMEVMTTRASNLSIADRNTQDGKRVASETSSTRTTEVSEKESESGFAKLRNRLIHGHQPNPPPRQQVPAQVPVPQPTGPSETELAPLKPIVAKTSAIFECLRYWIMASCDDLTADGCPLQDEDVTKLLFNAIEAALVGVLPDGHWRQHVESQRGLKRRNSTPLLFLGLQMRSTLRDAPSSLKIFEEIALSAQALLLHLMHFLNGFPSPAGVDQVVSSCTEWDEVNYEDESSANDRLTSSGVDTDGSESGSSLKPETLSFVFMESMILTVVGSLDSCCVRLVARDMTGLFTWDLAQATLPKDSSYTKHLKSLEHSTHRSVSTAIMQTKGKEIGEWQSRRHEPSAAVRLDWKSKTLCAFCKEKEKKDRSGPSSVASTSKSSKETKIQVNQVPWDQEQDFIANNVCTIKSGYVFHDESLQPPGSPKKPKGPGFSPSNGKDDANKAAPANGNGITPGLKPNANPGTGTSEAASSSDKDASTSATPGNADGKTAPPPASGSSSRTSKSQTQAPSKCECKALRESMVISNTSSKSGRKGSRLEALTKICNLFDMRVKEPNIGALDDERCLLDLVVDSIPMVFRDCGGDVADKTLLGGRFSMFKYMLMDLQNKVLDVAGDEFEGFSFLQRLIHDEECYAQLKSFLLKDNCEGANLVTNNRELIEFCDAVKKYERILVPNERLAQATLIYWEFLSSESDGKKNKTLFFPSHISQGIQQEIQYAQKALRVDPAADGEDKPFFMSGTLFHRAMEYVESVYFEESGILDRYVEALQQLTKEPGSPRGSGGGSVLQGGSVPGQLGLFDAFSIMEVNCRIAQKALQMRAQNRQVVMLASLEKPALPSITSNRQASRLLLTKDEFNPNSTPSFTPQPSEEEDSTPRCAAMDLCRLLLAQLGFLASPSERNGSGAGMSSGVGLEGNPQLFGRSSASFKTRQLQLLKNDAKLERSLKHLDRTPFRETMKIGVVFVGKNQTKQQEILANSRGNARYECFLHQLGWEIDLQNHRGFLGGLDAKPSLTNGKSTIYFADCFSEVIFHIVTKMPTKSHDAQQIDKKRHVGNDFVHIVWSENPREYEPSTISSHFNDVQIVIYPMRSTHDGLYRIQISTKPNTEAFGPLVSGMIVHESNLATLVRQTAMNANRVCRSQTSIYQRPYPTRKKLVDEIVERYAFEYTERDMLTRLFNTSGPGSPKGSGGSNAPAHLPPFAGGAPASSPTSSSATTLASE